MKKYKYQKTFTYMGKRYKVYANSEAELEMKLEQRKRAVEQNTVAYDGSMTVRQWGERAVPIYKTGQSEITRYKYMQRMRHCIFEQIGDRRLDSILPIELQQVINLRASYSKRDINEVYQQIRFLFQSAQQNGLIENDPTTNLQKPRGKSGSRRLITDEERSVFLQVCEDDRFILFLLMYYCGCRPSEAMEATAADIIIKQGKPLLHIRGTKTKNSDRIVPIPSKLYDRVKDKDGYLADHDGKKFTRTAYERLTKRLYREMNLAMGAETYRNRLITEPLAKDFTPYCLRHTFCSDLASRGVDIRIAQKLMGHSDITLTANIYTHIQEESIVDLYDLLDK